ncbi:hypothetical protein O181_039542 [Austropuccinia psidii MF-1]|uniref:SP-RING-type domain-containing protein n=1 Tax=Austropuccinia psidii MF-1 TaxID=1389203 RepID=A0A9Q3HD05_9BASI|nr:hypothetical protein [Austropuccinia psidii MF-1]
MKSKSVAIPFIFIACLSNVKILSQVEGQLKKHDDFINLSKSFIDAMRNDSLIVIEFLPPLAKFSRHLVDWLDDQKTLENSLSRIQSIIDVLVSIKKSVQRYKSIIQRSTILCTSFLDHEDCLLTYQKYATLIEKCCNEARFKAELFVQNQVKKSKTLNNTIPSINKHLKRKSPQDYPSNKSVKLESHPSTTIQNLDHSNIQFQSVNSSSSDLKPQINLNLTSDDEPYLQANVETNQNKQFHSSTSGIRPLFHESSDCENESEEIDELSETSDDEQMRRSDSLSDEELIRNILISSAPQIPNQNQTDPRSSEQTTLQDIKPDVLTEAHHPESSTNDIPLNLINPENLQGLSFDILDDLWLTHQVIKPPKRFELSQRLHKFDFSLSRLDHLTYRQIIDLTGSIEPDDQKRFQIELAIIIQFSVSNYQLMQSMSHNSLRVRVNKQSINILNTLNYNQSSKLVIRIDPSFLLVGENNLSIKQYNHDEFDATDFGQLSIELVTMLSQGDIIKNALSSPCQDQRRISLYENDQDSVSGRINILDPVTSELMEFPVRGINCQHVQCFDLRTFVQFNQNNEFNNASNNWICPIQTCQKVCKPLDLEIDEWILRNIIKYQESQQSS